MPATAAQPPRNRQALRGRTAQITPLSSLKPPRSAQSRVAIFKRLSQLLARLAAGDERAHAVDELARVAGHGGNGFARSGHCLLRKPQPKLTLRLNRASWLALKSFSRQALQRQTG